MKNDESLGEGSDVSNCKLIENGKEENEGESSTDLNRTMEELNEQQDLQKKKEIFNGKVVMILLVVGFLITIGAVFLINPFNISVLGNITIILSFVNETITFLSPIAIIIPFCSKAMSHRKKVLFLAFYYAMWIVSIILYFILLIIQITQNQFQNTFFCYLGVVAMKLICAYILFRSMRRYLMSLQIQKRISKRIEDNNSIIAQYVSLAEVYQNPPPPISPRRRSDVSHDSVTYHYTYSHHSFSAKSHYSYKTNNTFDTFDFEYDRNSHLDP